MLEDLDLAQIVDQAVEQADREMDAGRLRIVLEDQRHVLADRLAELMQVALDLLVGREPGGRRHHDRGRTQRHGIAGQRRERREPGAADADHHRHLARDLAERRLDHQARLVVGELVRLAHHAEDGDAVDAGVDVEADQPLQALQVERALVGKRCRGDHEHALALSSSRCPGMAALIPPSS